MYEKVKNVENGSFSITSPTKIDSEINVEEFKNELIKIYFKPNQLMSDKDIREAVEPHKSMLLNEIQFILNRFPEIYENFDFDSNFYYYSYDVNQISQKSLNRGLSLSVGITIK